MKLINNELTKGEELVMKAVWNCKNEPVLQDVLMQVKDIYGKQWASQTVSTFLSKLCVKDYIRMIRNGKIYRYKIMVEEGDYQKWKLKRMLMYIYNNDSESMMHDLQELTASRE